MRLARWLQESQPVALNYVAGEPAGLILAAGLVDRWLLPRLKIRKWQLLAYEQRKQLSQDYTFCWCMDDLGITYSGFWLLQED